MCIRDRSLPEAIILRKVLKPRLIATFFGIVALGIMFVARLAMFGAIFGGGRSRDGNVFGLLAMMILAPIAAMFVRMALSRSREYQADASGAHLLHDGEPLARALEKIEAYAKQVPMNVNPAEATAYIINPLAGRRVNYAGLFSTHPPTADRRADRPAPRPRLVGQSRWFVNCSGIPKSCSRMAWIATCRSSRFLELTRS